MTVRIDPDGVLAMSSATLGAATTCTEIGSDIQNAVDTVDHLLPGAPTVRRRVQDAAADLSSAGWMAHDHAIAYVDDVKPLKDIASAGYWLPDLSALGWRGDQTVQGNLERISRSDEFGSLVIGTGEGVLERYRNWKIYVPRTPVGPAKAALDEIAHVVSFADDVEVRGASTIHRGTRYVPRGPGGLLVPESVVKHDFARTQTALGTPRILERADDATYPPGRRLVPDPSLGRPPAWARYGGRGLVGVGVGLSIWDAGASQWEHDQKYHPEYTTTQRVASTSWNVATEGGGAIAGGIGGAKVGAALGATVGSVIPGLGTGVGAVVGGIVGGAIGGFVGSKAGKAVGTGLREGAEKLWNGLFG